MHPPRVGICSSSAFWASPQYRELCGVLPEDARNVYRIAHDLAPALLALFFQHFKDRISLVHLARSEPGDAGLSLRLSGPQTRARADSRLSSRRCR